MKHTTHMTLKFLATVVLFPQVSLANQDQQGARPSSPCEKVYSQIQKGFQERRLESPPLDITEAFKSCRAIEDQMMQTGMSEELKNQAHSAMRSMIESAEQVLGPGPRSEAKTEKQEYLREGPSFQNHH